MPRKDSETLPAIFLPTPTTTPTTTTRHTPKPQIEPPPPSDLLSRLNFFLPAISAANRDLEDEIAAGTIGSRNIENVGAGDGAYIEMNLGLGVLKRLGSKDTAGSESESESESEPEGREGGGEEGGDILGKLLKRPARGSKPGIQEVEQDRAAGTAKPKPDDDDMEIDPLEKR